MPNDKMKMGAAGAGLGLAALAAAAGAYYFYGSKHSAQHRRKMKAWTVRAQADMMDKIEQMKDLSREGYEAAVDQIVDKYKKVKKIDPKELAALGAEMKRQWSNLSREMKPAPKKKAAHKKARR